MNGYKDYMDSVEVSDTLHEKLTNLKAPAKKPAWRKYGAIAAALVLVVGLTGLGIAGAAGSRPVIGGADGETEIWVLDPVLNTINKALTRIFVERFNPNAEVAELEPDIAVVAPGEDPGAGEPGMKTIGGYEVRGAEDGPNTVVEYFMLPGIEYGEQSGMSADFSLASPEGGLRDAGLDDFLSILGCDEAALSDHLAWEGCTLTGTIGFNADGSAACAYLYADRDDLRAVVELCPDRLPPQCCIDLGQKVTTTEVWGVEVAGIKNVGMVGDGERGIYLDKSLRTEFLAHGVGVRATFYGTDEDDLAILMSRFVRWAVVEGLDLSGLSPDGAVPVGSGPVDAGGPNWNDSGETAPCAAAPSGEG